MIRLVALALLLINCIFWLWSAGYLAPLGLAKTTDTEPERLLRQLAPERITVTTSGTKPLTLPAVEAPNANSNSAVSGNSNIGNTASASIAVGSNTAAQPTVGGFNNANNTNSTSSTNTSTGNASAGDKFCVETGLYAEKDAQSLRAALEKDGNAALNNKNLQILEAKGVWLVYMGRYPNAQTQQKKQQEVRELNVAMTELPNEALLPGLSLGVYRTRETASEALKELNKRGIRTARVLQAEAKPGLVWLRANGLNAASSEKLQSLWAGSMGARVGGKPLQKCEGL